MPWLDRLREHEARHLANRLQSSAVETRERALDQLQHAAHEAGSVAHRMAGYARDESTVFAKAAALGAACTARAVRNDPLPVIIGLVGVLCVANLLLGRRTAHTR